MSPARPGDVVFTAGTGSFLPDPVTVAKGGTGQTTAAAARGSSGLNIEKVTTVADAAYTILATDRTVAVTSITAARVLTLPAASAVNAGQAITVIDLSGSVSTTNTVTVNRAGSDTVNGVTSEVLSNPYGSRTFTSDGTSKWHFVRPSLTAADQAVATDESTTSTTYVDLTTAGPAATVVVPASGKVWVTWGAQMYNSAINNLTIATIALSGTNTQTAATTETSVTLTYQTYAANTQTDQSRAYVFTGLTAGATTFTVKYRVSGGTGHFVRRNIIAVPLP